MPRFWYSGCTARSRTLPVLRHLVIRLPGFCPMKGSKLAARRSKSLISLGRVAENVKLGDVRPQSQHRGWTKVLAFPRLVAMVAYRPGFVTLPSAGTSTIPCSLSRVRQSAACSPAACFVACRRGAGLITCASAAFSSRITVETGTGGPLGYGLDLLAVRQQSRVDDPPPARRIRAERYRWHPR